MTLPDEPEECLVGTVQEINLLTTNQSPKGTPDITETTGLNQNEHTV